jgi:DNA-binding MarR family transcriptional regulator
VQTLAVPKNPKVETASVDLDVLPGHCIRRMQQIAVAIFLQEVGSSSVTPVQYAALQTVADQPGIDQRSLARRIGLDTSTIASVIDRLETRGLLLRAVSPTDRRTRLLTVTAEGRVLLQEVLPAMRRAQERMLEPLPPAQRAEFMRMLRVLVEANNELSRAPSGE